jgi:hypothetical protein
MCVAERNNLFRISAWMYLFGLLFMPRLSEKTLELTICSQISHFSGHLMTWFGLTQQEEARAGFDACTEIHGRLFIFQFKASTVDTADGARRFQAPHGQLTTLQQLCDGIHGVVFYVFPLVGNTAELTEHPDVINHTWALDVANIPALAPPTKHDGGLRLSGTHYVDVLPPIARFHSEPQEVPIRKAETIARFLRRHAGLRVEETQAKYDELRQRLGRKVYGGFVH